MSRFSAAPASPSIPTGGTTGQVLSKIDGTDLNTQWATPASGGYTLLASGNCVDLSEISVTGIPDGYKKIIFKMVNARTRWTVQTPIHLRYGNDSGWMTSNSVYTYGTTVVNDSAGSVVHNLVRDKVSGGWPYIGHDGTGGESSGEGYSTFATINFIAEFEIGQIASGYPLMGFKSTFASPGRDSSNNVGYAWRVGQASLLATAPSTKFSRVGVYSAYNGSTFSQGKYEVWGVK